LLNFPPEEGKPDCKDDVNDDEEQTAANETRTERMGGASSEARLIDFSGISGMSDLETLILDANNRVADFAWLKELLRLTNLTLQNLGAISNLEFLTALKNVKAVYLQQVPGTFRFWIR
jgi:hypothetical protein